MTINPSQDLARLSVSDFLTALAAKTSTPGGGSVAALTGSLAAAQLRMTLSYTLGKKKFADVEADLQAAAQYVDGLTAEFLSLMEQDRAAYETLCRFLKMAPEQQAADKDFLPAALAAVEVPMQCAKAALRLIVQAAAIVDKSIAGPTSTGVCQAFKWARRYDASVANDCCMAVAFFRVKIL